MILRDDLRHPPRAAGSRCSQWWRVCGGADPAVAGGLRGTQRNHCMLERARVACIRGEVSPRNSASGGPPVERGTVWGEQPVA
jgi:hypothetical protein